MNFPPLLRDFRVLSLKSHFCFPCLHFFYSGIVKVFNLDQKSPPFKMPLKILVIISATFFTKAIKAYKNDHSI